MRRHLVVAVLICDAHYTPYSMPRPGHLINITLLDRIHYLIVFLNLQNNRYSAFVLQVEHDPYLGVRGGKLELIGDGGKYEDLPTRLNTTILYSRYEA